MSAFLLVLLASCGWGTAKPTCDVVTDGSPLAPVGTSSVRLVPVVQKCGDIVDLQFAPDGTLAVVDQSGVVRWVDLDAGTSGEWLRLAVETGWERGLLGLAFHPKFSENGRFFLNYTSSENGLSSHVASWRGTPGPLSASAPAFEHAVYTVQQPYSNHNCGGLAFGPDGMLYVGWGDGGKWGDPSGNGQKASTALGTMLRLYVDGEVPYAVPPDNPFVGVEGALPEVWAIGLRNPWRYSFDPAGRLVAGDVGQNKWEEITFVLAGQNHGWNVREGRHCYAEEPCSAAGFVEPIYEYGHDVGQSVTGGYVVLAEGPLKGRYVFGDFGSGRIWSMDLPAEATGQSTATELGQYKIQLSTFGRDPKGRIYLADWKGGTVYRVDPG